MNTEPETTPAEQVDRRRSRLADRGGRYAVIAIDHRPPLFDLVRRTGSLDVEGAAAEIRADVVAVLGPHASAVLLDPVSVAGGAVTRDDGRGLIVAYEHHIVHERRGGRRQVTIPGWTVDQIGALGADAVKMLVWWHPDAWRSVRHSQEAMVVTAHYECVRRGLPLVLEPLSYRLAADPPPNPDRTLAIERHVIGRFAADRFGVDLFKIGCPTPDDVGTSGADRLIERHFAEIDEIVDRPWTLLSGGHDRSWFAEMVDAAVSSGASGYLAGRSLWWEAATAYPDRPLVRDRLEKDAVPYMQRLDRIVADRLGSDTGRRRRDADGPRTP